MFKVRFVGENGADARPGSRKRLLEAVTGVPRALREDLVAGAVGPPPGERPAWLVWQPAIVLGLSTGALGSCITTVNHVAFGLLHGTGMPLALLLGGAQALALVLAAFRPVAAWWMATAVMVALVAVTEYAAAGTGAQPWPAIGPAALTEPAFDRGGLYPWTGPGLATQAGVLLLLALRLRARAAAGALALTLGAGLVCGVGTAQLRVSSLGIATAVLVTAVVVGAALRGRQVARTELVVQEEMTSEERARRTLLEERNRIARELHDVVAHHMSVISIQAQVAPHLAENPSDALKENLTGIRTNAVEALTELRRVLGVLRSEDAPGAGGAAPHTPQPTLDRLDELVANVRSAGLTVTTTHTGNRRPLSPGVELSAFRIVQEALSNAMRHAPGARVEVTIAYRPAALAVRVTNTAPDRPVAPSPGAGHGLLGMRERTAMLGGDLAAGPAPGGGYEVTAVLPLDTDPHPADPAEDTP
ncbi:sensor histidine kinase [Streptomyces sp. NPDC007100]|uniref:sensor histidine kinase n=1 Tax=Streptomyces sp. NPDC007100 TaxID=3155602 RepID=UPI0033C055FB